MESNLWESFPPLYTLPFWSSYRTSTRKSVMMSPFGDIRSYYVRAYMIPATGVPGAASLHPSQPTFSFSGHDHDFHHASDCRSRFGMSRLANRDGRGVEHRVNALRLQGVDRELFQWQTRQSRSDGI